MRVITAKNVHITLPIGLGILQKDGIERPSRNGPVIVMEQPVTTHYENPKERVLFWEHRDANPFFHFMESLWMLAGRRDVDFLTQYVKRMEEFSDNGMTLHGAYGYRWIRHFERDQLATLIERLIKDPNDRRCVLTMWDPISDQSYIGKDAPCNTHAYLSINAKGALDMTVCCRSNDLIWGAYGANAVHFSILQEYLATAIGVPVGGYWQVSNNFHAYKDVMSTLVNKMELDKLGDYDIYDPYDAVTTYPIMNTSVERWREDLEIFMESNSQHGLLDPFFHSVAWPMREAHRAFKAKCHQDALKLLDECIAHDWQLAGKEWIGRRMAKLKKAQDDGPTYDD